MARKELGGSGGTGPLGADGGRFARWNVQERARIVSRVRDQLTRCAPACAGSGQGGIPRVFARVDGVFAEARHFAAIDIGSKHGIYGTPNRADVQLFALQVFYPAVAVSDLPNPLGSDWFSRAVSLPNWSARPALVTNLVTGGAKQEAPPETEGAPDLRFYCSEGRI